LDTVFENFKKINLFELFTAPVAEVFMGFVARQQYLAGKIVEQELRHEGEIAESTLRLLYENRVKVLWLASKKDIDTFQQYREYKVGREKMFADYFQQNLTGTEMGKRFFEQIEQDFDVIMRSEGVEDYDLSVEKGDAFEKTVREMADELGGDETLFYVSIYKRTSDIVHGNWRILERYHLERSLNPVHNGRMRYSRSKDKYAGLLPAYAGLLLSFNLLIKFFDENPAILSGNKRLYNSCKSYYSKLIDRYLDQFKRE
jgi:hypothetical protein